MNENNFNNMDNMDNMDTQYEQQNTDDFFSVSGVENITPKKKGKKAAIIGGISAAVVVGGCAAAYCFSDFVKNQIKLRLSSPDKYYAWVCENNAEDIAKSFSKSYKEALDKYDGGSTGKYALTYEASEDAKDLFLEYALGRDYRSDADDDEQMLIDIIDNIDDIKVGFDVKQKKNLLEYDAYGCLNNDTLATVELIQDVSSMDIFGRCPELTKKWVGYSLSEEIDSEELDLIGDILKNPEKYLSPEDLEEEIIKYVNVYTGVMKDVELEKKESVDICDISVNYTVATVELDEKTVDKLYLEMLKELKNDKVIKKLLTDKLDLISADQYKDGIQSEIDYIDEHLKDKDYYTDDDHVVLFSTYIDPTGTIRGVSFDIDDDNRFFCAIGKDGKEIRGELSYIEDGDEGFSVELKAEKEKDTFSGDIKFTYFEPSYDYYYEESSKSIEEHSFKLEFDDIKIANDELLYLDGDVSINIPGIANIDFSLGSDGESQSISYSLSFLGKNYGKLKFDYSVSDGSSTKLPDKSEAYMVDDVDDFDLNSYVDISEFEDFLEDIFVKIGLDQDLAEEAAELVAEEVYDEFDGGYYDDDYYDYWDY